MYKRTFHSSRQHTQQRKIRQGLLASFDYEANNNDRSKKDKANYSNNYNYDEDVDSDYFLNFDDESLLEELMELSDDFDEDDHLLFDVENELEELERLIDEQNNNNINQTKLSQSNSNTDGLKRIKIEDERKSSSKTSSPSTSSALEEALLQGVVPAEAGVGSNCLPGDFGFDPLGLATKDYFKQSQTFFLNLLPSQESDGKNKSNDSDNIGGAALPLYTKPSAPIFNDAKRPPALILRDYREAEIRHGRLAMLAAILWPLQEILDRLFIPQSFGHTTFVYGGVTLPFISLFMTLTMLLLGYLDIYAASIKDNESGDAFLPGECFWDPLSMLDGAPDSMKRKMQERELNNGRMAMIAVLSYIIQEVITHEPVVNLPWNQYLFEPFFEVPEIQAWLDGQFAGGTINSISVDNLGFQIDIDDVLGAKESTEL